MTDLSRDLPPGIPSAIAAGEAVYQAMQAESRASRAAVEALALAPLTCGWPPAQDALAVATAGARQAVQDALQPIAATVLPAGGVVPLYPWREAPRPLNVTINIYLTPRSTKGRDA